jgi:glycosyltransferase involved in cell wall biosynthesis
MAAKLSVIMSAYNSSETIERAITSILGQTFSDFELIVLNDGSTDETEEKVLAFSDERITYLRLEHAGLTKALNLGIAQAQGDIIVRHDSDDWSESDRFAKQVLCFENDDDLSLVASWHNVVDDEGVYLGLKSTAADDESLKSMMRWRNPLCHGSVAVRKSALEAMGGYNEQLLFSQDYDLWLRMAARGMKFACIAEPLYNYSITPDSIARGWIKLSYAKNIRQNVSEPRVSQGFAITGITAVGKRKTESLWNYALGSLALDDGRRRTAFIYFMKSLLKNPRNWHAIAKMGLALLPATVAESIFSGAKNRLEGKKDS